MVGAKKHKMPQRRTKDIIIISVMVSRSVVKAAKAGVSAIADPKPNKIPTRIRKNALIMIIEKPYLF
jgi:hypothetical protein